MLKIVVSLLIIIFSFQKLFAADIPIIVIAPSQKAQSKSSVGTSVTVFDEANIENSNDFFLGDVLANGIPFIRPVAVNGVQDIWKARSSVF